MKTEQIIYLNDIAQTHSITQTAQRFFISQQALSSAIKKLEEEFDTLFLKRTNQGVELTNHGVIFLSKARTVLDIYTTLKEDFQLGDVVAEDLSPTGYLHIFCHTRILEPLLLEILQQYTHKYPEVTVVLMEKENIEILEAITNAQGDLGIVFIPSYFFEQPSSMSSEATLLEPANYVMPDDVQLEVLFADEFIACCSKYHPITKVQVLEMPNFPTVPMVHFDTNPYMGVSLAYVEQGKSNQGHQYFSNNMSFHKAMIRQGLAVSVITSFEFRKLYFKYKDVTALPIKKSHKSHITLVTSKKRQLTLAAQLFIKMLKKYDFYGI